MTMTMTVCRSVWVSPGLRCLTDRTLIVLDCVLFTRNMIVVSSCVMWLQVHLAFLVFEGHLGHQVTLDLQDVQAHQVTLDSPADVGTDQDHRDHPEGLVNKVFVVLLVQPVPVDRQDQREIVGTSDQVGRLGNQGLKEGLDLAVCQGFLVQLDQLDRLVHQDNRDLQVVYQLCFTIFASTV